MSDTPTPAYPVEACNEGGPYPQDVAIRVQSYGASMNPPDGGGGTPGSETTNVSTSGMRLFVTISGATPSPPSYWVDPGDADAGGSGLPALDVNANGAGSVTYDYATAGTWHVRVIRDDGTIVSEHDVSVA